MVGIVAPDSRRICLAAVDRDRFRHAMAADRLDEEARGRPRVALLREPEIDGLSGLIDGAIEIAPLALDPNVRLVHPPADPHRPLAAVERRFQWGTVLQNPAVDRGVVD